MVAYSLGHHADVVVGWACHDAWPSADTNFYLLAFAYLHGALLVGMVPKVVPNTELIGPSLDVQFSWAAPLVFIAMSLLPRPREIKMPSSGTIDPFYSLFIFLMISVTILGSLAFMLSGQPLYIEAGFKTLVSMIVMLLLISWAWNPQPGFSGVGVFLSRYLLTIGLPFETWLQKMMECADQESAPDSFLPRALENLLELARCFPVSRLKSACIHGTS